MTAKLLSLLGFFVASVGAVCQVATPSVAREDIPARLHFAEPEQKGMPGGWHSNQPSGVALDRDHTYETQPSVRIMRSADSDGEFTTVTTSLPVDFTGESVELSGYLRVEDVQGFAALWLRADDANEAVLSFKNGAAEEFSGTADWRKFSVEIPLRKGSTKLFFGALLSGTGTAWVAGLQLTVDGKALQQLPVYRSEPTIVDTDHEFATGSGVQLRALTAAQVENLATLGEVWGFLKYHHPAVTSGKRQWDFDLFREMPAMLSARTPSERNARLLAWILSLGPVPPCNPCASLPTHDLQLPPDTAWLRDKHRFGPALSAQLQAIYLNRPPGSKQFYLSPTSLNGPEFEHELSYKDIKLPDSGYQLLLLFRWWNVLEWTSPNRALLPDLHRTLRSYVRPIALAADRHAFTLETLKLIGEARDSHSNLWSSLDDRPPMGKCTVPASLRFLKDQLVVWEPGTNTVLHRGDILTALDGKSTAQLVTERLPYYAGSNLPARLRDLATDFTRGACGPVTLEVRRGDLTLPLDATRTGDKPPSAWRHDLGGDAFHLLSPQIAYLQLGAVKVEDVASYVERMKGTAGLIIDIRNYPTAFMPFSLGPHLMDHFTTFSRFTTARPPNPGAFTLEPESEAQITPQEPRYAGKVILLVDEVTQSSAEYTTMALRQAPGAIVIGSHTAGADGNVSTLPLPFGMSTMISGLGVLTPELKTTQQVGISVDREVYPTAAGIAAGRDEVLEAAVRLITPAATDAEIQQLAHR